jgi:hypothetical protein
MKNDIKKLKEGTLLCFVPSFHKITVAHFSVKVNFPAKLTMLILHEYSLLVQLLP